MIILVRRYALAEGVTAAQLARRVKLGLLPLLKNVRGMRDYHIVDFGVRETGSVSIFENREAIAEANEAARGWVAGNIAGSVTLISSDAWETI